MDMAFFWSDRISFFPSHVDPFSLIDTLSFPVDRAESYLIIRVSLSVFCSFSVFMLHSYRPLGRCLLSRLRFHADSFSSDRG